MIKKKKGIWEKEQDFKATTGGAQFWRSHTKAKKN